MTAWKMVPVEATAEMVETALNVAGVCVYEELVDAAPPFVVTTDMVHRVADAALTELPMLDHVSHKVTRAVIEAFIKEAGR